MVTEKVPGTEFVAVTDEEPQPDVEAVFVDVTD